MFYRLKPAWRGRAMSAVAAGACALGVLAGAATEANAAYWDGPVGSLDRKASGSAYNLRMSESYADTTTHKANAGAHYPGGTSLFASWAEGWGYACHGYAAGQTLGAMLRNPHTITIDMSGWVDFTQAWC